MSLTVTPQQAPTGRSTVSADAAASSAALRARADGAAVAAASLP